MKTVIQDVPFVRRLQAANEPHEFFEVTRTDTIEEAEEKVKKTMEAITVRTQGAGRDELLERARSMKRQLELDIMEWHRLNNFLTRHDLHEYRGKERDLLDQYQGRSARRKMWEMLIGKIPGDYADQIDSLVMPLYAHLKPGSREMGAWTRLTDFSTIDEYQRELAAEADIDKQFNNLSI